ncbi:VOC family protein [Pseudomonas sp. N040]|uniref:VOC family protein n=1 Tax=Pseudomonas sp. N040 TaxID=2785325 RepID=UPI0018A2EA75|nr:VOC family protein [Pseudomonas sp. N040]MBF7729680.1 VOC family protein [Pseudomonas sp. N040]MBW7013322.1 VOC family protein [Pseudomonas sp. N040]
MFTYACLGSNDLQRAAAFYDAVLGALGLTRCTVAAEDQQDGWIGWGTYADDGREELALWLCPPFDGRPASVGNGSMLAFKAASWAQVEQFHRAALAHGGSCAGAPGLRPQYNPDFYAAYVRDPDGHKLAAVCRGFTTAAQA